MIKYLYFRILAYLEKHNIGSLRFLLIARFRHTVVRFEGPFKLQKVWYRN